MINEVWEQDFYKNDPLMVQFKAIVDSDEAPALRADLPAITAAWSAQMGR